MVGNLIAMALFWNWSCPEFRVSKLFLSYSYCRVKSIGGIPVSAQRAEVGAVL